MSFLKKQITLTMQPSIGLIGRMEVVPEGVLELAEYVKQRRPECVPEDGFNDMWDLLPHDRYDNPHSSTHKKHPTIGELEAILKSGVAPRQLSGNEIIAEISGRTCYDSFAEKAGQKTNKGYLGNILDMEPVKHVSIVYHAKLCFWFGGVSRSFSHQFIRNYVGADRSEEGSPSQESTRFTHHPGFYVVPPKDADDVNAVADFREDCQENYDRYCDYISREMSRAKGPDGKTSTQARKEVYEAGAKRLNMSAETKFIWTTNPIAATKFIIERGHGAADAEMQRFTPEFARICFTSATNLFLDKRLDFMREILAKS